MKKQTTGNRERPLGLIAVIVLLAISNIGGLIASIITLPTSHNGLLTAVLIITIILAVCGLACSWAAWNLKQWVFPAIAILEALILLKTIVNLTILEQRNIAIIIGDGVVPLIILAILLFDRNR